MIACDCTIPDGGMCPRHGVHKSPKWVRLCRTRDDYRARWDAGIGPGQIYVAPEKMLGDRVHDVLAAIGITEQRVSKILGRPCNCASRMEYLNRIHRRVKSGLSHAVSGMRQLFKGTK